MVGVGVGVGGVLDEGGAVAYGACACGYMVGAAEGGALYRAPVVGSITSGTR